MSSECCIKEGVSPVCVQACQFDIDVGSFLQSSTGAFQCILEAPKLLRCGAGELKTQNLLNFT